MQCQAINEHISENAEGFYSFWAFLICPFHNWEVFRIILLLKDYAYMSLRVLLLTVNICECI